MKLHCPGEDGYRKHIYEGKTLCRKKGWIANDRARVTCSHCLRKLERNEATLEILEIVAEGKS